VRTKWKRWRVVNYYGAQLLYKRSVGEIPGKSLGERVRETLAKTREEKSRVTLEERLFGSF